MNFRIPFFGASNPPPRSTTNNFDRVDEIVTFQKLYFVVSYSMYSLYAIIIPLAEILECHWSITA